MKSTSTRESSETENYTRPTCPLEVVTLSVTGAGQFVIIRDTQGPQNLLTIGVSIRALRYIEFRYFPCGYTFLVIYYELRQTVAEKSLKIELVPSLCSQRSSELRMISPDENVIIL